MTSVAQFHPALLNITVDTPPATQPVTIDQAKLFLRQDGTYQDEVITTLIAAATSWAEGVTRRAFIERALDVRFAGLPPGNCRVVLPFPPVSALTAITYEDTNGADQVLDVSDFEFEPLYGTVRPNVGIDWPAVRHANFAFTCGYGTVPSDIPEQIRQGILVAIASMYETRIDQTAGAQFSAPQDKASAALLADFKVFEF